MNSDDIVNKILIVDDKIENLCSIKKILMDMDVKIIEKTSFCNSLEITQNNDFALAIVDIQMPEMDSYKLWKAEESTKDIPVIFICENNLDLDHQIRGYESGAVDFITRPFIPKILKSKVKVFLDLHRKKYEFQKLINELNLKNKTLEQIKVFLQKICDGLEIRVEEQSMELSKAYNSIYNEILERKALEERIIHEKEFTENALDSQLDTFFVFNSETGQAIYWNKTFKDISGYSDQEIKNQKAPESYYNKEDLKKAKSAFETLFLFGKASVELNLITKDKKNIPFEYNISYLKTKSSKYKYVISIGRNTSERIKALEEKKRLEDQISQFQKMEAVGTLAGGIAHDFNNLLGIILGNIELAIDELDDFNPALRHLREVEIASHRARDVIKQLLSITRNTKEKLMPLNIIPVVKESVSLIKSSVSKLIKIEESIPKKISSIYGNPTQINQIMINLGANAYYAMKDRGGILKVELSNVKINEKSEYQFVNLTPGNYVNLKVSDTGTGIDSRIKDRIFEPYFTTKEVGDGSGMGLAIIHGIVKNHNGLIHVDSKIGKGTVFNIFFPAINDYIESEKKILKEIIPKGNEYILFVDDDKLLAEMGFKMLSRLGYHVEIQTDPSKALEVFRNNPDKFNLIITDMTMPVMTGDEFSKKILHINPQMKIILCTGYTEKITKEESMVLGIKKYVEKPLNRQELATVVREVLDN